MPRPHVFGELSQKKLILISGKGGVGKTTLSAALALRLSQEGRKVLLAEIDSQGQVAALFNKKALTYQETRLRPNLYGINVTPKQAFEEYVTMQLKFHAIYTAVFDNKYVRTFIEGVPGLAELMCIGKIYAMVSDYDTVVVDAPATGNSKSLLQIPTIVSSAVRVGPLKTNAERIERLLKDPDQTCLAVVTLPEEMPVAETIELQAWVRQHLEVDLGLVLINGLYPPLLKSHSDIARCKRFFEENSDDLELNGLHRSFRMRQERSVLHTYYIAQLRKGLGDLARIEIPYFFTESLGLDELNQIGETLAAS